MKCLTGKCPIAEAKDCKGLCMKCYSAAKKMVEGKLTTWDELINMGMIHVEDSPFFAEFKQKKGQ